MVSFQMLYVVQLRKNMSKFDIEKSSDFKVQIVLEPYTEHKSRTFREAKAMLKLFI